MHLPEFNKAIRAHQMVLVDVYADWCEPCKMLDSILEELAIRMKGSIAIIKIDADASNDVKAKYHIRSVPVLMLFKNGELVWRMNGFMMASELESKITAIQ